MKDKKIDGRCTPGWKGPAGSQWTKGKSTNPARRALKDAIDKQITYDQAAAILIRLANDGNTKAIEMLLDRSAGKSLEEIEVQIDGNVNTPLDIKDLLIKSRANRNESNDK